MEAPLLTHRDAQCLFVGAVGLAVVGIVGSVVWPEASTWLVAGVGIVGLLAVQLALFRRMQAAQEAVAKRLRDGVQHTERQLEAVTSLYAVLRPSLPLPPFGGWSITPEIGRLLVAMVLERQPRLIVECGSGVSTLLCAYALRKIGRGRVVSLDHEPRFAEQTRTLLSAHGVADWVDVAHAPLVPVEIGGAVWQWYDTASLKDVDGIDVLIVDGPPGNLQQQSRYPAVPLLLDRLAPDAIILLDDADRKDEQAIVQRWLQGVAGFQVVKETVSCRGIVLQRHGVPAASPGASAAMVGVSTT